MARRADSEDEVRSSADSVKSAGGDRSFDSDVVKSSSSPATSPAAKEEEMDSESSYD